MTASPATIAGDEFVRRLVEGDSNLAVERIGDEQLRQFYPLNMASDEQLQELRRSMRVKHLRANKCVFRPGESPQDAYWLLDGVLQLTDVSETRMESVTAEGGLKMPLPYMVPSAETAECVVDSRILCLQRETLNELFKGQPVEHKVRDDRQVAANSREELFAEFERLRSAQRQRISQPDEAVEGAVSTVSSTKPVPGRSQRQAPVTHYQYVTKGRAVDAKPRAVSSTDLKQAFAALERHSGYRKLKLNVRAECLMHCESVQYEAEQLVVEQNQAADFWYLILQGECKVEFQAGEARFPVNAYKRGDTFGEDGLITGLPRNASVIANTSMQVLRLPVDNFKRLLEGELVRAVSAADINSDEDALWVDLRLPNERSNQVIKAGLEIPWPVFRSHPFPDNDGKRRVYLVAEQEINAKPLAYMMRKFGFDAYYVAGGFAKLPETFLEARSFNHRPAPGGVVRLV